MSECGANGRFSIVALTRRIVMRSDIELQSVLRYRRINSRCANGEVHIAWLGRRIFERTQDCIDASLVSRALRLQPFEDIGIKTERNGSLRWDRLETAPSNAADDVL